MERIIIAVAVLGISIALGFCLNALFSIGNKRKRELLRILAEDYLPTATYFGICNQISRMWSDGIIEQSEKKWLLSFVGENKPSSEVNPEFRTTQFIPNSNFYWPCINEDDSQSGDQCPYRQIRIRFINHLKSKIK